VSSRRDLPKLLDCRAVKDELGVSRAAAEAIMRLLPKVVVPGLRKTYVLRDDVLAGVKTWTRDE
jgi:hypothetical protein